MSFIRKYNKDTQIWFMSDLHFGHSKSFIYEKRGFKTIEEHNEKLLANIKECVSRDDEFYILGDLTLGDLAASADLLRQLPGKIHIILGNHDTENRIEFYQTLGWDVQYATRIRWDKYHFYLSHYPTDCANPGEDKISLATINIHGHVHQKDAWTWDRPFSFNVCPEANENRPIPISEIVMYLIFCNIFHKEEELFLQKHYS